MHEVAMKLTFILILSCSILSNNCRAQSASVYSNGYQPFTAVYSKSGNEVLYAAARKSFLYNSFTCFAVVMTVAIPANQSSKNPTPAVPAKTVTFQSVATGIAYFKQPTIYK